MGEERNPFEDFTWDELMLEQNFRIAQAQEKPCPVCGKGATEHSYFKEEGDKTWGEMVWEIESLAPGMRRGGMARLHRSLLGCPKA